MTLTDEQVQSLKELIKDLYDEDSINDDNGVYDFCEREDDEQTDEWCGDETPYDIGRMDGETEVSIRLRQLFGFKKEDVT